jgi:hypothetical protein
VRIEMSRSWADADFEYKIFLNFKVDLQGQCAELPQLCAI